MAYTTTTAKGVVEQFSVNHQEKEFARSVAIKKRVGSSDTRAGMTGTMVVDRAWRTLKSHLPRGTTCKTEAGRLRMMRLVRAAQWKCCVSTGDRWVAFCKAASAWAAEHEAE